MIYLVFAGQIYGCSGGWNDYQDSFADEHDAQDFAKSWLRENRDLGGRFVHIVELPSGRARKEEVWDREPCDFDEQPACEARGESAWPAQERASLPYPASDEREPEPVRGSRVVCVQCGADWIPTLCGICSTCSESADCVTRRED